MVMKASRSEAAREAVQADESNLPHARLQRQAPGGRRWRPSCGEGDAARAMRRERRGGDADAEAPQAFKEGASTLRNAQNRIQFSLFCGGVGG